MIPIVQSYDPELYLVSMLQTTPHRFQNRGSAGIAVDLI